MIIYESSDIKVHRLLLNDKKTNCFIVRKDSLALLIDPVDKPDLIIQYLRENNITLKYMMSTHAHFDHVFAASGIIEQGSIANLFLHEADFSELQKAKSFSAVIYKKKLNLPLVKMFDESFTDFLSSLNLGIKHVGGHTKGSCYVHDLAKKYMFTGDLAINHRLRLSLFDNRENIKEFYIFLMGIKADFHEDTIIFPGHGDMTQLGIEFEKNTKWHYIINKHDSNS